MFVAYLGSHSETPAPTAPSPPGSSPKQGGSSASTAASNIRVENIKGLGKREVGIVDNVWYLIEKIEKHNSIGNQFSSTQADGVFVVVRVAANNTDKETHSITTSLMKLLDDKGRDFSTSSKGETALAMSGDQSAEMLMAEVQPDTWKHFALVYDVPESAKGFKLKVPSGMLSLDKEVIIKAP